MVAGQIMPSAPEPLVSVVVSDDASPDDSVGVLRRIADPRLRVQAQAANVGGWRNWAAALGMARGDFVVFLGDDDWLTPDFLRKHLEAFRQHPAVCAGFSPMEEREAGKPSRGLGRIL